MKEIATPEDTGRQGDHTFQSLSSAATAKATHAKLKSTLQRIITVAACVVAALPSTVVNTVTPLAEAQNMSLIALNSTKAWQKLFDQANGKDIAWMVVSFLFSGAVIGYFRYLYFIDALKKVCGLFLELLRKCFSPLSNDPSYTGWQIFWHIIFLGIAVAASLPFAVIFSQPFQFIPALENTVFAICIGSYASIRFKTLIYVFDSHARDMAYFKRLTAFFFFGGGHRVNFGTDGIATSETFLVQLNQKPAKFIVLLLRHKIGLALAILLDYLCVLPTMIAVMAMFIPAACQGWQKLLGANIDDHSDYRNTLSLVVGTVTEAPTLFFYARSLSSVFVELFRLGYMLRGCKEYLLYLAVLVALFAAFTTSQGYEVTAIAESVDYSYLGDLQASVPGVSSAAITAMVWSHLLQLMQQKLLERKAHIKQGVSNQSSAGFANSFRSGVSHIQMPKSKDCGLFAITAWRLICVSRQAQQGLGAPLVGPPNA